MNKSENILKWYPFKENANILDIYKESSIFDKIDINVNIEKLSIEDMQNGYKITNKYDYITLIGTFEYASTFIKEEKQYSTFLKILKDCLKPNGKILIAIDNRLGIKYLSGAKSEYYEKVFEAPTSEIRNVKPNLLLKSELEKFINEAGIKNYKFYYPLPDYKLTNTIFTDELLPKSNNSKLIYPINYEAESLVVFNEINVIKQICDNGDFVKFTNSYLIEISNDEIETDIKFVNYNIFRKPKYQLILNMSKEKVEKSPATKEASKHIENIDKYVQKLNELGFNVAEKVEEGKIISNIILEEELDRQIVLHFKEGKIEEAYNEIERYYNYISERLKKELCEGIDIFEKYEIEVSNEIKEKMTFIKNGFIDLSFENVFVTGDEYLLYDQEWYFENIPLELILYRAINNLFAYNSKKIEENIKKEELYEKFKLTSFIEYFEQIEKVIQKDILDEEEVNKYRESISECFVNIKTLKDENKELTDEYIKLKELYDTQKEKRNKIEIAYDDIQNQFKDVSEKYNKLLHEYNTSRGWKLVKKYRKLTGKGNK